MSFVPKNCHYISRFLTAPWETPDRQLVYFKFSDNAIARKSSKNLFASDGLNDADTEDRLNKLMETPVGRLRDAVALGASEVPVWHHYRAFALLLMLQAPRSSAVLNPEEDDGSCLAKLLQLPVEQLDAIITKWLEGHRLVTYRVERGETLLFPSTGIFLLPVADPACAGGFDFAMAMPISTKAFLARIPIEGDLECFLRLAVNGNYFARLSVGLNAEEVVFSPALLDTTSEETLKLAIRAWRESSRKMVETVLKLRGVFDVVRRLQGPAFDPREGIHRVMKSIDKHVAKLDAG